MFYLFYAQYALILIFSAIKSQSWLICEKEMLICIKYPQNEDT